MIVLKSSNECGTQMEKHSLMRADHRTDDGFLAMESATRVFMRVMGLLLVLL